MPLTMNAEAVAIRLTIRASSSPAASLAATMRPRWASRVKVTMAVRWLHSLVTSMMPSTGSRKPEMKLAIPTKSSSLIGSSCTSTTISATTMTAAARNAVMPSSQTPARVS